MVKYDKKWKKRPGSVAPERASLAIKKDEKRCKS